MGLDAAFVRLADGRRLTYQAQGPADGAAVLYFHGCPGSRLDGAQGIAAALDQRRIRLVTVDRPGFGGSDPCPGRTLGSWADDVQALADELGIERFAAYGMSAGGPYALAVAARLGTRVTRVGLAAGVGPPGPAFTHGMGGDERILYLLARRAPWLARWGYARARRTALSDPDKLVANFEKDRGPHDLGLLAVQWNRDMLVNTFLEALRQGPAGVVADTRLFGGRWDFDASSISVPVDIWHGDNDRTVPLAHAERVAALIPHATLHRCPGEGHMLAFERAPEILAVLAKA
jgi:pimeloyl-ACP methyl ester carboxylesterase